MSKIYCIYLLAQKILFKCSDVCTRKLSKQLIATYKTVLIKIFLKNFYVQFKS